MGVLSNRVNRSKVKAGDHVYTWRAAFTYSHHGIYIGEGKVVHFTPKPTESGCCSISVSSSSSSLCSSYTFKESCTYQECAWREAKGGVVVSCLDCFIAGGSLYLFDYNVSRFVFLTKLRGGTCTTAKSDPPEDSVKRAEYLVGKEFGEYNVMHNNCEDFALYCKTGLVVKDRSRTGGSGQVTQASFLARTTLSAICNMAPRPYGAAVSTGVEGFRYIHDRYYNDMGVRTDVDKVEVEDLARVKGLVVDKKPSESN